MLIKAGEVLLSLRVCILGWMCSMLVPNCKCNLDILTPLLIFLVVIKKQKGAAWKCWLVRRKDELGNRGGVEMWQGEGT